MIVSSISHSSTSRDCYCLSPGHFVFRIRTAKGDIAKIILHSQDKYLPLRIADTRKETVMHKVAGDARLDYWETDLEFDVVCLRYWFELTDTCGETVFYSNYAFPKSPVSDTDDMFDCPQNLREEERFLTPAWAENKVIYQVFPSRFASSKTVDEQIWYKAPVTHADKLQGDLRGIIEHLDDIHALGADILYMTPIFFSNSCHKYDTIDYYCIDPSFGTIEDLKELVDKAHRIGMRVILDGVFNHTSQDFFAFADIKKNEWDSKYIDWYFIQGFPLRSQWGEKPNYKTFSYFGGMPKLNLKNPDVERYVTDVALYWLRECGIDGWRLDVGDEISHRFWRHFRTAVKAEFPEALIVGEVWHYAEDFLQGDEWDTVMNYPFYQNILRLVAHEEITAAQFAENLGFLRGQLHRKVFPLLWNLVGSHDTPRIMHQCGGNAEKVKLVAALQLLLPGMPMIYYGDEVGMEGAQDPDCRRGMRWDPDRQNRDLLAWYKRLISVRRQYPEILSSDINMSTAGESSVLIRTIARENDTIYSVFNCSSEPVQLMYLEGTTDCLTESSFNGTLPGWRAAVLTERK